MNIITQAACSEIGGTKAENGQIFCAAPGTFCLNLVHAKK